MNQHYEISLERIQKSYEIHKDKKRSSWLTQTEKEKLQKVEHLSTNKYDVLHDRNFFDIPNFGEGGVYYITDKPEKDGKVAIIFIESTDNFKAESVREKLHNIQKTKEFYESTQQNK